MISEYRLYGYILDRLEELGWNKKPPFDGGQVFTQNEALRDPNLKSSLGADRPENIVVVDEGEYWAIEAKASLKDIDKAVEEAKVYADKINRGSDISCRLVTGIAGNSDETHYVETQCLVGKKWKHLLINDRQSTGFISPSQAKQALQSDHGTIDNYDVPDKVVSAKIQEINKMMHEGAIHKRGRAETLACLLLALANDSQLKVSSDPTTIISDINSRAKRELTKHRKGNFFHQIAIKLPTSTDNHVKFRNALAQSIERLRDLNIASMINSGRDILGQCYEQFLKYANDAKEIGIVLTPRHITNLAAEVVDVRSDDIVFDPTCGTGGFLVAALDRVNATEHMNDTKSDAFKAGNLHGIEQDSVVATLAVVNMVFRGDGSSNIVEGDSLIETISAPATKVLMNPPFALADREWRFVDRALEQMKQGGLLFAVLPTTVMGSADDGRGELTWRKQMLKRHTLISVVKLPEMLFSPMVLKGTYAVIIKAGVPHDYEKEVLWGILKDGIAYSKTQCDPESNMAEMTSAIAGFINRSVKPKYVVAEMDCSVISSDDHRDLSPEFHLGRNRKSGLFDMVAVKRSLAKGIEKMGTDDNGGVPHASCEKFEALYFFGKTEKGSSGRKKNMRGGGGGRDMPLVTTSENNNGISSLIPRESCKKTYPRGSITISANGSSCKAHYHDYEFAANSDVHVCFPKEEFSDKKFCLFLCAAINQESWRFNYYNKLSLRKLRRLTINVPSMRGKIDMKKISDMADE